MASTSLSGVASLKLNQVASSKFVASFYACGLRLASSNKYGLRTASSKHDCGLRVAFPNIKVGFHTDTTKFGLRAIATLHEIGLCEFGRVASTSLSGAASFSFDDWGLGVASAKLNQAASSESVAFPMYEFGPCESGRVSSTLKSGLQV